MSHHSTHDPDPFEPSASYPALYAIPTAQPDSTHQLEIAVWILAGALGAIGIAAVASSAGSVGPLAVYLGGLAGVVTALAGFLGGAIVRALRQTRELILEQRRHFDARLTNSKLRQADLADRLMGLAGMERSLLSVVEDELGPRRGRDN